MGTNMQNSRKIEKSGKTKFQRNKEYDYDKDKVPRFVRRRDQDWLDNEEETSEKDYDKQ